MSESVQTIDNGLRSLVANHRKLEAAIKRYSATVRTLQVQLRANMQSLNTAVEPGSKKLLRYGNRFVVVIHPFGGKDAEIDDMQAE
jgi:hypothetical protein